MAVIHPRPRHNRGYANSIPRPILAAPTRPNFNNYPYTSTIKVAYQNVNGWKNKVNEIRLSFLNLDLDVFLIAHTGLLDNKKEDLIKMNPYTCYQHNPTGEFYAGVGICVKKNIKHRRVTHKFHHDTIAVQIETPTGPIILATNYHRPELDYLPIEDLEWLANHQTPTYLLADLNSHHSTLPHHNSTDLKGRVLHNVFLSRGRLIHIGPAFPTFHAPGSPGTAPDIVLTNKNTYHNHYITPLRVNTSDHIPIKLTISSKPIFKKVKCEHTDAADWTKYAQILKDSAEPINLRHATQNDVCTTIASKISSIQDARKQSIPQIKICTRPFIPVSLKFKRLTSVLCHLTDHHSKTNNLNVHLMLNRQRRKTIQLLREEGRLLANHHWLETISKLAELRAHNPRKYWKHLKKLMGRPAQAIKITHDHTAATAVIKDLAEIVQHMTNVWSQRIGPPPPHNIAPETHTMLQNFFAQSPDACKPHDTADFNRLNPACKYSKPIPPIEVYNTITSFKYKAPGDDSINKQHLSNLPKIFIVQLAHIFTACLSMGYFPDNLKSAIMIFIPKPDKPKHDPVNYRPISLISIIAKIYGKILTARLTTFLADKHLNHPMQYGFTKNRGTHSALAMVYEYIARLQAGPYPVRLSLVLRDIKSAFDRLDHRIIKYHLAKTDPPMPSVLCKALSSFLDGRTARIRIGSTTGNSFPLLGGVPQGASPSAPLFNLVISNAPRGHNCMHQYSGYADDCNQIIATTCSKKKASSATKYHGPAVIRAIKTQNEFEHSVGLISEPAKSWVIPVNQRVYPKIVVEGQEYMQPDRPVKLLGLSITKTSFTKSHVAAQAQKANEALGSIGRFYSLPTDKKLQLVKLVVFPHLTYPPIPLHTAAKTNLMKLQSIQSRALKWVLNIRWYDFMSNKKIHEKLNVRALNQELYWRARKTWDNIKDNNAADLDAYQTLMSMPYYSEKQKADFPSSYEIAMGPEPRPIYK